ncbi:MAG: transketolase [Gemmatimonadetes bacterium 13_1_40CM_66_11]|nr:MAG: transketolase [Gemmatimonadetes bacterium 13_1_40CM_66_11]
MTETVTRVGRELDQLCINTVRALAMDAVQQAESGHPGTPMALAPLAYVLWQRHLRYNPANPDWPDRDRFVLSAGHACMLLYSVLYLTGYDLTLDEIKQFRQWGSRTPGHSEHGVTPGVEATTGPLGQGVGNAVGMAIAEAQLAALFNRPGHAIIDHHTYFVASDGDLMEGVSHEACSLAGHLKLGKLIGFYDDNRITIDGSTDLAFSDDTAKRFEAYGWHVQRIQDGNDLDAIDGAITQAKRVTDRPSLIIVRTHIAWGSPHKQDTAEAHGAPLGVDEVKATKQNLGWPSLEPFYVPEEALEHWRRAKDRGARLESDWQKRWDGYRSAHPDLATELERRLAGQLPAGWDAALPVFGPKDAQATRAASGKVLNAIAAKVPELIGGSADLTGSNNTEIKGGGVFSAAARTGRNFHFGVREHGMGAALNGITLHGGFIPFGGTFLIFSDYMRPSIRLAALTPLKPIYVFTHDSIGLGEDGPTHQPIEQLAALRAIPNMTVIRPSDPTEVVEAWRAAIAHRNGPVALGGYVLADSPRPDVVLMATGSEVELILGAYERLKADGRRPRAVSMPCLEYFAKQQQDYREAVLPPGVPRIAVEAAAPQSWYRWVPENQGVIMGIERFGESAPYQRIYQEFGLTVDAVVAQATDLA